MLDLYFVIYLRLLTEFGTENVLFKLQKIGVCDDLLNWITDYLIKRRGEWCLRDLLLICGDINSGVTQGSVLRFFKIYINDIIEGKDCQIKLFANDTLFVLITKIIETPQTRYRQIYRIFIIGFKIGL